MSSSVNFIFFGVVLVVGHVYGGFLSAVPAATLAVSSPLIAKTVVPASPIYPYAAYSAYSPKLLSYTSYGNVLGSPIVSSPYVASPAYYKYALPYVQAAAPAVYLNPGRAVVEAAPVAPIAPIAPVAPVAPVAPAIVAEDIPEAREAAPENNVAESEATATADDAPQDE